MRFMSTPLRLVDGGGSHIHRQHGDPISLVLFFQDRDSRLKRKEYDRVLTIRVHFLTIVIICVFHLRFLCMFSKGARQLVRLW
jgi:hypothetical protein